jgi:hypothetical protein
VADGKNGLRVLQMISPDREPNAYGFTPRPKPLLIATYKTHHPALSVSRGLDRDRVVDETGGQTVVFGRRGSRPFHVDEMRKFYRHADGDLYKVEDVRSKVVEEEVKIGEVTIKKQSIKLETKSGKPLAEPKAQPKPAAPQPRVEPPKVEPLPPPPANPAPPASSPLDFSPGSAPPKPPAPPATDPPKLPPPLPPPAR